MSKTVHGLGLHHQHKDYEVEMTLVCPLPTIYGLPNPYNGVLSDTDGSDSEQTVTA